MDVNLAVNNLLSRDDEGDDDGGDCDTYMSGNEDFQVFNFWFSLIAFRLLICLEVLARFDVH